MRTVVVASFLLIGAPLSHSVVQPTIAWPPGVPTFTGQGATIAPPWVKAVACQKD